MTAADFERREPAACAHAGDGDGGAGAPVMDTYVVELHRVDPNVTVSATRLWCQERCFGQPETCAFVERRCLCGGRLSVEPEVERLGQALDGFVVGDLASATVYCLRVVALQRGALGTAAPTDCACDDEWFTDAFMQSNARLCAVSTPQAPGLLPFSFDVRCPGDGANAYGGCLP